MGCDDTLSKGISIKDDNNKSILSIATISSTSEFIVNTNINNDVSILGVAEGRIRDSKTDPWRDSYLACYQLKDGRKLKAEINEDLYYALHLIFDTILELHS